MDQSSTRDVRLPEELHERIESRVQVSEFDDVEEYVVFTLRETVAQVEAKSENDGEEVDADEVESRLRALGYLDG